MHTLTRIAMLSVLLALAIPATAQRNKKKAERTRHSTVTTSHGKPRATIPLNVQQTPEVPIPQESSLHANLKNKPKVVIVPAPPPPPGPTPVAPRTNP